MHNYDEDLFPQYLPAEILDQLLSLHSSANITPAGFDTGPIGAQRTPALSQCSTRPPGQPLRSILNCYESLGIFIGGGEPRIHVR